MSTEAVRRHNAAYRAKHKEQIAMAKAARYYAIRDSDKEQQRRKAYRLANIEREKKRADDWRAANQERAAANAKVWRGKNLDKLKAQHAEIYAKNREIIKQRTNAYRLAHPEWAKKYHAEYRAKNADRIKKIRAEWTRKNKDKVREAKRVGCQKRYALKIRAAMGDQGIILGWERRWRKNELVRCYWCLSMIPPAQCHQEHVIALSIGGAHTIENLCISCSKCNHRKHRKSLESWNKELLYPVLLL